MAKWFRKKSKKAMERKFTMKRVEEFPKVAADKFIYIVQDGSVPDTLIFMCPCGCDDTIYLNLLTDTRPNWKFYINKRGITISPSVRRKAKCKSHFYIINGKVRWCEEWDYEY